MAFNLSNAVSGAGGALAEVGGEMARTEIRKGAELDLMRERSALEEARSARIAELQSTIRVREADLEADRRVQTEGRLSPILRERERAKPRTFSEGQTYDPGDGSPQQTFAKTPTPLNPVQEEEHRALAKLREKQAGLVDAQTRRTDDEGAAIRAGTRWGSQNPRPNDQQVQRNVSAALTAIDKAFKADVDDLGRPKIDADSLPGRKEIAGLLVRGGMSPEEAANAAIGAPVPSRKAAEELAKKDYKEHPGRATFGSSIEIDGKDMTKDEYIKARTDEYLTRSNREFDRWMQQYGLRRSARPAQGAPAQGASQGEAPRGAPQSSMDEYRDGEKLSFPASTSSAAPLSTQEEADLSKPAGIDPRVFGRRAVAARPGMIDSVL